MFCDLWRSTVIWKVKSCTRSVIRRCLSDGRRPDVLYNKFSVDSSSPRDSPTNYTCVVATSSQWQLSRCSQQHPVVCQSDHLLPVPLLSGTIAFFTSHNEVMCCPGLWVGRVREFVTFILNFVKISWIFKRFFKTRKQWLRNLSHCTKGDHMTKIWFMYTLKSTTSGLDKTSALHLEWE